MHLTDYVVHSLLTYTVRVRINTVSSVCNSYELVSHFNVDFEVTV